MGGCYHYRGLMKSSDVFPFRPAAGRQGAGAYLGGDQAALQRLQAEDGWEADQRAAGETGAHEFTGPWQITTSM